MMVMMSILQCFSHLCRKVVVASSVCSCPHLFVHRVAGLVDLFELSNNSDVPIRVKYLLLLLLLLLERHREFVKLRSTDARKSRDAVYVHCDLLQCDVSSEECCDNNKLFSFSLKCPDRLGGFFFPLQHRQDDHWRPSEPETEKGWSYTSAPTLPLYTAIPCTE